MCVCVTGYLPPPIRPTQLAQRLMQQQKYERVADEGTYIHRLHTALVAVLKAGHPGSFFVILFLSFFVCIFWYGCWGWFRFIFFHLYKPF